MPTQHWSSIDAAKRRQEMAQMEACDVPRVSRNENLRAAFQVGQPQRTTAVTSFSTVDEYFIAGVNLLSPTVSIPSASISQSSYRQSPVASQHHQRYNTQHLRPVPPRSFRKTESTPAHRTRTIINRPVTAREPRSGVNRTEVPRTFVKRQPQPPSLPSDSEATTVEPESNLIRYRGRSARDQELRRSNPDSDSSYVPSIQMTVNKPVTQYDHRQRPRRLTEEGDDSSSDVLFIVNEDYHHSRRSSYQSRQEESNEASIQTQNDTPERDVAPPLRTRGLSVYAVTDPPVVKPIMQPVIRKVASWVAEKLHNSADQVAGAVGLRPLKKTESRMLLD